MTPASSVIAPKSETSARDSSVSSDKLVEDDDDGMDQAFDEDRNVDFCVNVDIGGWDRQMEELKSKIPADFMCLSKQDVMVYSRI